MSTFVMGCCRAYRRIARAFPHQYRAICGDGLEQLGEDLVPRVWQQQGVVGLIRLFGDLALRLPCEHFSTWADRLREATMADDVFEGTWRARQSEPSLWKVDRPAPQQAYLRFEPTDTGYLMVAYGVVNGEACAERPQMIIADGRRRPLLDLSGRPIPGVPAGAMTFGSRPDPQTLELGSEVDGQVLVAGRYKVSADGKTLTVTNKGSGPKGGPFEVVMVLERVVPDPYRIEESHATSRRQASAHLRAAGVARWGHCLLRAGRRSDGSGRAVLCQQWNLRRFRARRPRQRRDRQQGLRSGKRRVERPEQSERTVQGGVDHEAVHGRRDPPPRRARATEDR